MVSVWLEALQTQWFTTAVEYHLKGFGFGVPIESWKPTAEFQNLLYLKPHFSTRVLSANIEVLKAAYGATRNSD